MARMGSWVALVSDAASRIGVRARVSRLWSPVGLLLAGLLFALPFLTVSCTGPGPAGRTGTSLTYTFQGTDLLTGGHADLTWRQDRDGRSERVLAADDYRSSGGNGQPPGLPIDAQPFAIVAVVLLLAGVAAALAPIRELRALGAGAAALLAATALVLSETQAYRALVGDAARYAPAYGTTGAGGAAQDAVRTAYGFWLALGVLAAVAVTNLAVRLDDRAKGAGRALAARAGTRPEGG
jgi:hypothetical protein